MKKFISNYHTHNNYCDGKNTMEEMVLTAIERGLLHLGISSHAPIINEESWTMDMGQLENYIEEIAQLKKKYKGKINIYAGLEIDYFSGLGLNPLTLTTIEMLDYYIGSIHTLYKSDTGDYCFVDDTKESFSRGIDRLFDGNVQNAVRHYYKSIEEMVIRYEPTIVGHLDIIKKNNIDNCFFNENDSWYKEIITDLLGKLKKSKSIIEINTGGIPRYGDNCLYPSSFILEEMLKNNMDLTVNGDSHNAQEVDFYYDEIYKMLKDIGFKRILMLTHEGWSPFEL